MRYFKNPHDSFNVYGYDENDPTQEYLIIDAEEEHWEEVTGSWPPDEFRAKPLVPVEQTASAANSVK